MRSVLHKAGLSIVVASFVVLVGTVELTATVEHIVVGVGCTAQRFVAGQVLRLFLKELVNRVAEIVSQFFHLFLELLEEGLKSRMMTTTFPLRRELTSSRMDVVVTSSLHSS